MISLVDILKRIRWFLKSRSFFDLLILLIFNLVFAFSYLFSSSDRMIGFPVQQDGYLHMIVIDHISGLVGGGSIPYGVTWFELIRNGVPRSTFVGPTYLVYVFFSGMSRDYILSWKLTAFFYYLVGSVAMYFLARTLVKNRVIPIVSSVSYAFFQPITFVLSLGHIGEVSSFALLPIVILFYVKGIRQSKSLFILLSALILSMMIMERPDYGYFGIVTVGLFAIFFIIVRADKLRMFVQTAFFYAVAFLISFPFVYLGYLSRYSAVVQEFAIYGYIRYSPEPYQIVTPSFGTVEAYLGISVLVLSAIGIFMVIRTVVKMKRQKAQLNKKTKTLLFLFILAIFFVLIGLGANTPLYGFLGTYAPFFQAIRAPSRWLVPAQLCLSVLAGHGAFILIRTLFNRERTRALRHEVRKNLFRVLTIILAIVVFIDVSTYVSSPREGWSPVGSLESGDEIYVFPQTAQIPAGEEVYRRIAEDRNEFRILSAPVVYSLPYYQHVRYLSGSKVTMTHGYGLTTPTGLQGDVYDNIRHGNITEDIGEKMALAGAKYVIYDFNYGKWPAILQRLNSSQDLQFVLEDDGYFLYRNKRFGDSHMAGNLIENGGFEEGEEGWSTWYRENGTTEVDRNESRNGNQSMKSVSTNIEDLAGRVLVVNATALDATEFTVSGWSKCEDVSGENPLYAIRANVVYYGDGEDIESSGSYADFSSGTHDWEFSSATFSVNTTMELKSIKISAFLRNATGTAWFDDIYLNGERLVEEWEGAFLVSEMYEDYEALLSEENKVDASFEMDREKMDLYRIELETNESAYVILGVSYDESWRLRLLNSGQLVDLQDYKGLLMFFIEEPGSYEMTMKFVAYEESLGMIGAYCGGAVIVAVVFIAYPWLIPYMKRLPDWIRTRFREKREESEELDK